MFNNIYQQINGITEMGGNKEINCNVFPDPATDIINLTFDGTHKDYIIEVRDLTGKVLLETVADRSAQSIKLDINNLSPGFYVLSINDGVATSAKHFIKQ